MKVTIELNGKKVDVELTAEQVKELGLQKEKKTGWERAEYNENYYRLANSLDKAWFCTENNASDDNDRYDSGNYFTDRTLAEKMRKRVRLMLRMQRWADKHNKPLDWNDGDTPKYYIYYNNISNTLRINYDYVSNLIGEIYFSSLEIAKEAIEEFGDEIIDCYVEREVMES